MISRNVTERQAKVGRKSYNKREINIDGLGRIDYPIRVMKDITYKTWKYQIPFEIVCTISGQVKTYTSEEFINGKIERFGGLDKLREKYVCRDAERLMKQGKSKEEVIELLKSGAPIPRTTVVKEPKVKAETTEVPAPEKTIEVPVFKPMPPVPLTKETATPDTCYNPGFKLNGNPCSACAFKGICISQESPKGKLKQLISKEKKVRAA